MERWTVGVVGGALLVTALLVFERSGALGIEMAKTSGLSVDSDFQDRWSMVGSIVPEPKSASSSRKMGHSERQGVAIVMDRTSSKTFALRPGDSLPGSEVFRVEEIAEQKLTLSDGVTKIYITRKDDEVRTWGVDQAEDEKFSPLGALEAYYRSLSERADQIKDSEAESYEDMQARIDLESAPDTVQENLGSNETVMPPLPIVEPRDLSGDWNSWYPQKSQVDLDEGDNKLTITSELEWPKGPPAPNKIAQDTSPLLNGAPVLDMVGAGGGVSSPEVMTEQPAKNPEHSYEGHPDS